MINEKLLKIAERAISIGWSLIPVGEDKVPLIPWKKYQTEKADLEQIKKWLEIYPSMQLGVATGKLSNLLVVDFENGADFDLIKDKTFKVRTGSGGVHAYFQHEEGFKNAVRIFPLVDIRSEGGYCVTVGSKTTKGEYSILNDCPIVKMSPETRALLLGGTKKEVEIKTEKSEPASEEIQSDAFFLLESYPGYGKGVRNEEITRFIGKVLSRIHPAHWETYGWEIIVKANQKNTPPLSTGELYASFRSIKGIETRKTPLTASTVKNEPNNALLEHLSDGSDEVKHISIVASEQVVDQDDVYPLEMKCFDDLIMGGASPGDLVSVAGRTGEGKSSIAQDWTLSFIRGPKKAPVLWFSYELLPSHLWKKFKTMGMTEDDITVIPAKHTSGNVAWVEAKVKEAKEKFNIKVVVIDHLGFLLPKTNGILGKNMSQNHATFVTQIVRDLKTIALSEEVIIVLPVHVRKTNGALDIESIKDTAGVAQESDLVFLIERERDTGKDSKGYFTEYTKITLAKNRKTGQTLSAWFTMINERFAYSDRNEDEKKAVEGWNEMTSTTTPSSYQVPEEKEEKEVVVVTKSMLDEIDDE